MSETLTIPDLGDANVEATVIAVLVEVGATVEAGQTILEAETDKAMMEIPAEYDAVVDAILVGLGDQMKAGVEFARVTRRRDDEDTRAQKDENENTRQELSAASQAGRSMTTHECSTVRALNSETDPVNSVTSDSIDPQSLQGTESDASNEKVASIDRAHAAAGPATRRLARELGIAIGEVVGGGRRGRISKADVKAHAKRQLQQRQSGQPSADRMPLPPVDVLGPHSRKTMTGIQKATSRNMTHSVSRVPHACLQQRIDVTDLEVGRRQLKSQIAEEGGSLTVTALLCKALGLAVCDFPIFNAVLDDESEEIIYREEVNVGVAVDTQRGLVVPVLRNADVASVLDISRQLKDISMKAKAGRLALADMRGASITVSNLGGIGTSGVFPLINWPEASILGVGASEWLPLYPDGDTKRPPEPRLIMTLTLAFDHRLINGADGARFLQRIKVLLESPFLLLFKPQDLRVESSLEKKLK
mgnify:CR=1 FL=1